MAATRWQTPSISGARVAIVEQRVQRGEPLVAGADVVATIVFEVAQERDDPFEAEVGQLQAGDLGALVGGDEQQEQADGVAVAAPTPVAAP